MRGSLAKKMRCFQRKWVPKLSFPAHQKKKLQSPLQFVGLSLLDAAEPCFLRPNLFVRSDARRWKLKQAQNPDTCTWNIKPHRPFQRLIPEGIFLNKRTMLNNSSLNSPRFRDTYSYSVRNVLKHRSESDKPGVGVLFIQRWMFLRFRLKDRAIAPCSCTYTPTNSK